MRDMDVEDLLIWTYRDQRADLYAAGMHMLPLERIADGHRVFGRSTDGCAAIDDRQLLGTVIDVAGRAWGGVDLDDDAEHVHGLVQALGPVVARLLVAHAMAATRPDPGMGNLVEFRPIGERRSPLVEYAPIEEGQRARVRFCPLILIDRRGEIGHRRRIYAAWRAGLELLAYGLRMETGRLRRHRVTGPLAPLAPWSDQGA